MYGSDRNSLEIEGDVKIPLDSVSGNLCLYRWAVRCGDVIRMEHIGPTLSCCFSWLVSGLWWGGRRRKAGEALEGHCAPELLRVI